MDATVPTVTLRGVVKAFAVLVALIAVPAGVGFGVVAAQPDGTRDLKNPAGPPHPGDPFPMPPEFANLRLMEQTAEEALAKSAGCVSCHQTVGDPHCKNTLRIGCTDCHG